MYVEEKRFFSRHALDTHQFCKYAFSHVTTSFHVPVFRLFTIQLISPFVHFIGFPAVNLLISF